MHLIVLLTFVSLLAPTHQQGLPCKGCDCAHAITIAGDSGHSVCFTMFDRNVKTVSECETQCAAHGAKLPQVTGALQRLEIATFVQEEMDLLTGTTYGNTEAVYVWMAAKSVNGSWQWTQINAVSSDIWSTGYPVNGTVDGTHAVIMARRGYQFGGGHSDVHVGQLLHADATGKIVTEYKSNGVVAKTKLGALCACQAVHSCALSDLALNPESGMGTLRFEATVTELSHGIIGSSALLSLEKVHIGAIVTMHCADGHSVIGGGRNYTKTCEDAGDKYNPGSAWSPTEQKCTPVEVSCTYTRNMNKLDFHAAEAHCVSLGGHLVTFFSLTHQTEVLNEIGYPFDESLNWIGLNSARLGFGNWEWMSSPGKLPTYTNWGNTAMYGQEPNGVTEEVAVIIAAVDGEPHNMIWGDVLPDMILTSICEQCPAPAEP